MRGPARFRSSQRLSGGDISRILASGRRIKVEPILAHVLSNGLPWARLGVVVPKRQFRRAVDRNRIRRQLR
ncbi:MAG: ribonuclease P protein component, partial [Burkholderiales bacterium]|nr:ribonuclease P protein component [Burkholderiales bacterium]